MYRLLILLSIFFTGCSAPIITANSDKSADFTSYKSYSFANYQTNPDTARPDYNNPENRQIIELAISNELTKIGYRVMDEGADLLVVFDIIITDKVDPRVDSAVIYKPWVDTKTDTFNYTEGLLVVRLIDQSGGAMVWQGSLSGILNNKPEKFGRKADSYMTQLFASLVERVQ